MTMNVKVYSNLKLLYYTTLTAYTYLYTVHTYTVKHYVIGEYFVHALLL